MSDSSSLFELPEVNPYAAASAAYHRTPARPRYSLGNSASSPRPSVANANGNISRNASLSSSVSKHLAGKDKSAYQEFDEQSWLHSLTSSIHSALHGSPTRVEASTASKAGEPHSAPGAKLAELEDWARKSRSSHLERTRAVQLVDEAVQTEPSSVQSLPPQDAPVSPAVQAMNTDLAAREMLVLAGMLDQGGEPQGALELNEMLRRTNGEVDSHEESVPYSTQTAPPLGGFVPASGLFQQGRSLEDVLRQRAALVSGYPLEEEVLDEGSQDEALQAMPRMSSLIEDITGHQADDADADREEEESEGDDGSDGQEEGEDDDEEEEDEDEDEDDEDDDDDDDDEMGVEGYDEIDPQSQAHGTSDDHATSMGSSSPTAAAASHDADSLSADEVIEIGSSSEEDLDQDEENEEEEMPLPEYYHQQYEVSAQLDGLDEGDFEEEEDDSEGQEEEEEDDSEDQEEEEEEGEGDSGDYGPPEMASANPNGALPITSASTVLNEPLWPLFPGQQFTPDGPRLPPAGSADPLDPLAASDGQWSQFIYTDNEDGDKPDIEVEEGGHHTNASEGESAGSQSDHSFSEGRRGGEVTESATMDVDPQLLAQVAVAERSRSTETQDIRGLSDSKVLSQTINPSSNFGSRQVSEDSLHVPSHPSDALPFDQTLAIRAATGALTGPGSSVGSAGGSSRNASLVNMQEQKDSDRVVDPTPASAQALIDFKQESSKLGQYLLQGQHQSGPASIAATEGSEGPALQRSSFSVERTPDRTHRDSIPTSSAPHPSAVPPLLNTPLASPSITLSNQTFFAAQPRSGDALSLFKQSAANRAAQHSAPASEGATVDAEDVKKNQADLKAIELDFAEVMENEHHALPPEQQRPPLLDPTESSRSLVLLKEITQAANQADGANVLSSIKSEPSTSLQHSAVPGDVSDLSKVSVSLETPQLNAQDETGLQEQSIQSDRIGDGNVEEEFINVDADTQVEFEENGSALSEPQEIMAGLPSEKSEDDSKGDEKEDTVYELSEQTRITVEDDGEFLEEPQEDETQGDNEKEASEESDDPVYEIDEQTRIVFEKDGEVLEEPQEHLNSAEPDSTEEDEVHELDEETQPLIEENDDVTEKPQAGEVVSLSTGSDEAGDKSGSEEASAPLLASQGTSSSPYARQSDIQFEEQGEVLQEQSDGAGERTSSSYNSPVPSDTAHRPGATESITISSEEDRNDQPTESDPSYAPEDVKRQPIAPLSLAPDASLQPSLRREVSPASTRFSPHRAKHQLELPMPDSALSSATAGSSSDRQEKSLAALRREWKNIKAAEGGSLIQPPPAHGAEQPSATNSTKRSAHQDESTVSLRDRHLHRHARDDKQPISEDEESAEAASDSPPVTRSHCRFTKLSVSVPVERSSASLTFVVPECSIRHDLLEEEGSKVIGNATKQENTDKIELNTDEMEEATLHRLSRLVGQEMLGEAWIMPDAAWQAERDAAAGNPKISTVESKAKEVYPGEDSGSLEEVAAVKSIDTPPATPPRHQAMESDDELDVIGKHASPHGSSRASQQRSAARKIHHKPQPGDRDWLPDQEEMSIRSTRKRSASHAVGPASGKRAKAQKEEHPGLDADLSLEILEGSVGGNDNVDSAPVTPSKTSRRNKVKQQESVVEKPSDPTKEDELPSTPSTRTRRKSRKIEESSPAVRTRRASSRVTGKAASSPPPPLSSPAREASSPPTPAVEIVEEDTMDVDQADDDDDGKDSRGEGQGEDGDVEMEGADRSISPPHTRSRGGGGGGRRAKRGNSRAAGRSNSRSLPDPPTASQSSVTPRVTRAKSRQLGQDSDDK